MIDSWGINRRVDVAWKLEFGRPADMDKLAKKNIEWLEIRNLIKADDPSPFQALTQLQVYGRG